MHSQGRRKLVSVIHERVVYPIRERPQMRFRGTIIWILLAVLVIVFGSRTAVSYYVDSLWFSSLGYAGVFWRTLELEWATFAVPFLVTFLVIYGWAAVLRRGCRAELQNASTIVLGNRTFELPVDPALRIGSLIASVFFALISGASFLSEWARFAIYWFAPTPANAVRDPIFGRTVDFYFFTLPVQQFIFGWLLMIAILCCAIAGLFILFTSSSRLLREHEFGTSPLPWRCLSGALAFLLVVVAGRTWLGRFDRIVADHTVFGGVTYTDQHVILRGLFVICAALILGAGIAGMNVILRPRTLRLIAASRFRLSSAFSLSKSSPGM